MTWTRTPPTKPGTYRCRFLPADGVDTTPFDVDLVEDDGTLVAEDWHSNRKPLEAYMNCEWHEVTIRGRIEEALAMTNQTLILTRDNTWERVYIVGRLQNAIQIADAPAATPHATINIDDITKIELLRRAGGPPPSVND